ncbi:MAG: molybdopterin-dependent oxidoreductase [Acidimicrobiales bacterium]
MSFTVCFLTGLLSHLHQNPLSWLTLPSRPAGFYRLTQGLHVVSGVASIPLLLGKLWAVYPQLWTKPTFSGVANAVERLSLIPLVAGSLFLFFTGTINIAYWYAPMKFYFTAGHYWAAWITIGALIAHIGAKLAITRVALSKRSPDLSEPAGGGLSRRGFVTALGLTSGVLVVSILGQTVTVLRRVSVLAPRRPDFGPQGFPINRSAVQAAIDPATVAEGVFALSVEGKVAQALQLSLADLRTIPQREATLPIACVEGWSYSARWRGVALRELLARAGASLDASVRIESLEAQGVYRTSPLNHVQAHDRDTLLALELEGEPLALDHGFPLRLISPNRPGVQQTKWVHKVVVL